MSRSKFPRAFLVASSVLIALAAVSPQANASDKGKSGNNGQSNNSQSESHGKKASKSTVDSILKAIQQSPVFNGKGKKFENDGKALQAQSDALLKKLAKLGSANPVVLSAISTYKASVDTATATLQIAVKNAKDAYKAALATATTEAMKKSAETAYKVAIAAARQSFNTAISSANFALKTALLGLATPSPSPSATPSPSPSASVSPTPSPSPSST